MIFFGSGQYLILIGEKDWLKNLMYGKVLCCKVRDRSRQTERNSQRQKENHRQTEYVQTKTLLSDVDWLAARDHLISLHPAVHWMQQARPGGLVG